MSEVLRSFEKTVRGLPVPCVTKFQPQSLNALRYPLLSMLTAMLMYLGYLIWMSGCQLWGENAITMTECGNRNQNVFASVVYGAVVVHLMRGLQALQAARKVAVEEAKATPLLAGQR